MNDNELLKINGWDIECESPFEIRHEDGSFATGQAANIVLDYLKPKFDNPQYRYEQIEELLEEFSDGEYLYKTSPVFNQVIQMLIRNVHPYRVIENLCDMNDEIQKSFQDHLLKYGNH